MPVPCSYCGQPSSDEASICALCFDRGLHLQEQAIKVAAAAALHAVGTMVELHSGHPGYEVTGVVVGCRVAAYRGDDIWTVLGEDGSWHDVAAPDARVLDPTT